MSDTEVVVDVAVEEVAVDNDVENGTAGGPPLTKKEKDKLKAQKKKEREKAEKEKKKAAEAKKAASKGAGNAAIIKEALRKQKEEEERLQAQIDAEEARLAEIAEQKKEKARIELERRELQKQKKRDRIARQKADGTYMTAEQKAKQRMAEEKLEIMKQQGMIVEGLATGGKPASKSRIAHPKKKMPPKPTSTESTPAPTATSSAKVSDEEEESSDDAWDADSSADEADATVVAELPVADMSIQSSATRPIDKMSDTVSNAPSDFSSVKEYVPPHESADDRRTRIKARMEKRQFDALAMTGDLRSPIICVMGHVDTGKTKMLDRIRRTNVQDGEAGGITQQIGATEVPASAIAKQGAHVKDFDADKLEIPGFLIIDTPGHESFRNLRSRGSNLCDMAILIVDIMHGLEPQTLESISLLQKKKCPFVIGLNKIDRLYEWKSNDKKDIRSLIKGQKNNTQIEFDERLQDVKRQFAEQGINVALFWENPDVTEYISMVPTSAVTGDGVGNLMVYMAEYAQRHLRGQITSNEALDCTVLEVKALPGMGTTIDVILVNGRLKYGDTIILAGTDGAITTQIRELLMPAPLKEMRVKNEYVHFKELKGAQGVKILAKDLDTTLAGLPLMKAYKEDEQDILREEAAALVTQALKAFKMKSVGVHVQASTLGSLEALLDFLRSEKIPYCGINIGPVHKKDVAKASTMIEKNKEWAVILAFDVKIERESQALADEVGVKIFSADIIYHLQDAFIKYRADLREKDRQAHKHLAIFPCRLHVLPQHIFKTRDPIIVGVRLDEGTLKVGTPLCVPSKECMYIGTVSSIEDNGKPAESAVAGQEVCIKIQNTTGDAPRMYDRHFTHEDEIVSRINRESIDVCKQYFREDLSKGDWNLVVKLKKALDIM